ncbi:MAG: AAA family ATPase [Methanomicrobiales archaeon]|nr:AAA family ATPase [Methanomicrobiales archaeon]
MAAPCRIAVTGKGGTGKTTLAALLAASFLSAGVRPILAVDADPNANYHEALGLTVRETLGSMREEAFTRSIPPGMSRTAFLALRFRQVLVESDGLDLIAMGRPEGTGCYCFANNLLAEAMAILQRDYRLVIIDSEAGLEHISRGTIGTPDLLLVVTDPGMRGIRTASRIREIAVSLGLDPATMHLVINRDRGAPKEGAALPVPLLGRIPEDPAVQEADLEGRPLVSLPPEAPSRQAVAVLAGKILAICGGRGRG